MYAHHDCMVAESGMRLIMHTNSEDLAESVGPFTHGSSTDVMETQALKQALDVDGFDLVFDGTRRNEEKSQAKERVFSFRPRPSLGPESPASRAVKPVFPLSN